MTKGTNEGIIKAINEGIISSTTVMINMPYSYEGIKSMDFKSTGNLTLLQEENYFLNFYI
ncbi:MAG: ChbG/HpnK family deacetylase [Tissierellia bacterium]|nr:ChbG/HpnK family deacetylase [Tissierellia bacterium]